MFFDKYKRAYTTDVAGSPGSNGEANVSTAAAWLNETTYSNHMNLGSATRLSVTYDQGETDGVKNDASISKAQLSFSSKISDKVDAQFILGSKWARSFKQAGFDGFEDLTQNSFLSLSDQGVGTSLSSNISDKTTLKFNAGIGEKSDSDFDGKQTLAMAGLSHKVTDKSVVSLEFGLSRESNQLMGTELGAGFSSNEEVDTKFVSLALQHQLKPNLNIGMNYSFGQTSGFEGDSLIKQFSGVNLDAAELWLAYQGNNQSFKAGLSRELGYRSGNMLLSVPTSVSYEGQVGTVHFDEQEIDLESATVYGASLSYARNLGKYGSVELMGKFKASQTGAGTTGFGESSFDTGVKYKLAF